MDHESSLHEVRLFIYISLVASIFTFLIRLGGYILFGNSVLLVESLHMLVDILISAVVIVVVYLVRSKFAKKYPYGLYKIEDLSSLLISILVIMVAVEIAGSIFSQPPVFLFYSAIVEVLSIVPLAAAGYIKLKVSSRINSPSLRSDAVHSIGDSLEGFAVAFGLYLSALFSSTLAYYATLAIALITLVVISLDILKNSIFGVLDLPKDKRLAGEMSAMIEKKAKGTKVSSLKVRWAGPVMFAEIVLRMEPELTIEESHRVADDIERELRNSVPQLEGVTIHIEPTARENFKVFIPLKLVGDSSARYIINKNISTADYFATAIIKHNVLESLEIQENEIKAKEFRGVETAERIAETGFTDILVRGIGEMTFGVLLRHRINIWRVRSDSVDKTLRAFLAHKLHKIEAPTLEASWRRKEKHE